MHLKINGTLLSAPPDLDAVEVQQVREVVTETLLSGQQVTRVAPTGYTRIVIGNSGDNGINRPERLALNGIQIGDTITIEENYSSNTTTIWTGCVVVGKQPMKRLIKDGDTDTSDWYTWGFELLHNTEV